MINPCCLWLTSFLWGLTCNLSLRQNITTSVCRRHFLTLTDFQTVHFWRPFNYCLFTVLLLQKTGCTAGVFDRRSKNYWCAVKLLVGFVRFNSRSTGSMHQHIAPRHLIRALTTDIWLIEGAFFGEKGSVFKNDFLVYLCRPGQVDLKNILFNAHKCFMGIKTKSVCQQLLHIYTYNNPYM